MRLLHTSDWHLGQTLHNFDRCHEHESFLAWLVESLVAEEIDALLIAGDVFDNANPSAASQKLFYTFLQQAKRRLPFLNIIIIAGNHDSPGRLEAPRPLLDGLNVAVVGHVRRFDDGEIDLDQFLIPLFRQDRTVAAWCLAVPFLRPGDVPRVEDAVDPYQAGIALLYQRLLARARERREPGQAIIALGHCHMLGGEASEDSERRIVMGNAEALPDSIFDDSVAYAALGHLHKAQRIGKREHVRYCGSPLPMSFTEIDYAHQVLCVDLEGEAVSKVAELRVPRTVELLRIPRRPAPVDDVLAALAALEHPFHSELRRQPYLQVRISLDGPEPGLRARIEAALEGKHVRLAKIETTFSRRDQPRQVTVAMEDLERVQPEEIFRRLYAGKFGTEASAEQLAAFGELLLGSADEAGRK